MRPACGTTPAASRSRRGRTCARPRESWTRVRAIAAELKDDMIIILNPAPALLKLAAEVLAGEIAAGEQRFDRGGRPFPQPRARWKTR